MKVAHKLGIALVVLPVLAASAGRPPRLAAPQSPFGDVTLSATPAQYEGKCPVRIHFIGTVGITVHPMAFNYHFERSDGARSQLKVVRVNNPNAQLWHVNEWWQLGAPGQHVQVWEKLLVASGNTRIESSQASADITCK